jgi:CCR4-NOT complex subunit CAF16
MSSTNEVPKEEATTKPSDPMHINVNDLTFGYVGREPVLRHLNMQLTNGARCLLIGANGAGKSTILRILSGRHLTKPDGAVTVLGRSAFHDTRLNFERSYLDTDWGMRTVAFAGYGCPLQADIPVFGMMEKLQAEYPQRRNDLIKLLGIDLSKTIFCERIELCQICINAIIIHTYYRLAHAPGV